MEVIRSIQTDTCDKFDASEKNSEEDEDVESVDDRVDIKIDVESVTDADGPMQPKLDKYAPRKFSTETFERDFQFQADWYKKIFLARILRSESDGLLLPMPTVQRNKVQFHQLEKGRSILVVGLIKR